MNFIKIWVLADGKEQNLGDGSVPILFNIQNIVSIKPIRILRGEEIINGYWIRTTNNKKYRASKIPSELEAMFRGDKMDSDLIANIDATSEAYETTPAFH